MRIVVDASVLLLFLRPDARVPRDRSGRPSPEHARERVEHLIDELEKSKTIVVVPTPVLAEVLVRASSDDARTILERLSGSAFFSIEPFEQRAAIELAEIMKRELEQHGRRGLRDEAETWAKLKFDRQVIAIAKVCGAGIIIAHDKGLKTVGERAGLKVIGLGELPLPPEKSQRSFLSDLLQE